MATSKERDMEHQKGHLAMNIPPIVSREEWEAARQQLLVKEKALTRSRDALAAERRRMPWPAVEKKYEIDGPKGKVGLLDLFQGRRQLIVYRAFFEPGVFGWPEHACRGCSLGADQVAHLTHLNARDTTLAHASRAPGGTNGLRDPGSQPWRLENRGLHATGNLRSERKRLGMTLVGTRRKHQSATEGIQQARIPFLRLRALPNFCCVPNASQMLSTTRL
jgi:hypothetical protein